MRPHIDRQIATGQPVVTRGTAARCTPAPAAPPASPKLIPVTDGVIRSLRRAQRAVGYVAASQLRRLPRACARARRSGSRRDPARRNAGRSDDRPDLSEHLAAHPRQVRAAGASLRHRGLRPALCRHGADCRPIRRHQRDRHGQPVDDPAPAARDRDRSAPHRRRTRARRLQALPQNCPPDRRRRLPHSAPRRNERWRCEP